MNLPSANWNYPTSIRFGAGRAAELPKACRRAGTARPLLVTDPALAEMAMVRDALAATGAGLFSAIHPNPTGADIAAGLAAFRAGHHDGVIAFGGGSALDVGKVIAFMSDQSRPLWDFEDKEDWWRRADPDGIAPVIAVPTTAGTGSEVGRAGVITDEATHTKKIIFHPKMMPAIVIMDPALMVGLPAHLTAATGMDALAHNLEAYCAPAYHPMADGIALEGMRLVKEWLPVAVADGKNLVARALMAVAASMGATAFQKGLGAIHSLSHPVGSVYDAHHGLTNAVYMPYVLALNRSAISEYAERVGRSLDLENPGLDSLIDWVLELRKTICIPHTLAGLKVGPERFDELAAMAAVDPTAGSNPVKVGPAELKGLYENALAGRI
jgi:alcohol dehydrogenase class IV